MKCFIYVIKNKKILEEVCTKKGFLPAEEYELRHGRKALDVTLNVRFSGLPNHAKLELVKSQRVRAEGDVAIAIQVDDDRLQHVFPPGASLWDVLTYWENRPGLDHKGRLIKRDNPNLHPVCTYMREEVVGEFALRETTLRMLGLTGGSAMFRLTHRQIDEDVLDQIRVKIENEKSRRARILEQAQLNAAKADAAKTDGAAPSNLAVPFYTAPRQAPGQAPSTSAKGKTRTKGGTPGPTREREGEGGSAERDEPVERIVTRGARAVWQGTSRQTQEELMERQRQEESLAQLENIPGVQVIRPTDFDRLTPEQQQEGRQIASAILPGLFGSNRGARHQLTDRQPGPSTACSSPFSHFKFPENTRGQDLYHNEQSDVTREDFQPCDRETCLFSLEEVQATEVQEASDELPDDFFEVTVRDVQRMYHDLQKNLASIGNDALTTSAMRLTTSEERMARYPLVIIRVQFPDCLVLQGVFRPRETIFSLEKFVKEHIKEKSKPFYLYTSPPKNVLKDTTETLFEAGLVPMSVVYFGTDRKSAHHLSESVLREVEPRSIADRIVYNHISDKARQRDMGEPQRSRPKRTGPTASTASTSDQHKIPKWFKVGKK